jgi:hemolysin activation/secretion protein
MNWESAILSLFHARLLTGGRIVAWLALFWVFSAGTVNAANEAAEDSDASAEPQIPHYKISGFTIEGRTVPPTNTLVRLFSKYAGTNVSLVDIVQAASDLELEYLREGYPSMNIVIAPKRIVDGIVPVSVFPGAVPQIVVAGKRFLVSEDEVDLAMHRPLRVPTKPTAAANTATNPVPKFTVRKYLVTGNTLLPQRVVDMALTNVPGAYGTNVSFNEIRDVVAELQNAYRVRGFVTVAVDIPQQKLTNATLKLEVVEGRLNSIIVKGNHYFSSNNVMRALPGLYPGMILNGETFQAELNRANNNQDRQIYSSLSPGPDPGTSDLTLQVKDRMPLHGKAELNNQSSPGTPDLRLNISATYNNLWDWEHSVGFQYGFSPWEYKNAAHRWNFYDDPLVANYSAFYRMPLGTPEAIDTAISGDSANFGYNEATRRFVLPPTTGQPEFNLYASRSTIDTALNVLSRTVLYNVPGVRTITQETVQQDLTMNNDIGSRLSAPVATTGQVRWNVSGGFDFKTYETVSAKTNNFLFEEITLNNQGIPNPPILSEVSSPVPLTDRSLQYMPISVSLNGNWRGTRSLLSWGLTINGNLYYSGSVSNLHNITGSLKSTGHWITANPNFTWQFFIFTNWQTTFRADGQVSSEPLISVEQFSAGGVNSVRGYQEGEVFGDDGWHVGIEQLTPPHTVGMLGRWPLVIRGSIYMDYAHTYIVAPAKGQTDGVALWGTGVGMVASLGSYWEARFLFSLPLLKTYNTASEQPYFNFALTAQF